MFRAVALSLVLIVFSAHSVAAEDPVYTGLLSNTGAGGYDVVSYFDPGKPVKGSSSLTSEYLGVTWRFASADNKARFDANPEEYVPAYGGYCAWAVSQGYLAKGDPEHWTVRDGRLYLNYNQEIQDRWLKDTENFIRLANENWPAVLEK
ncbi:YHS domain-containing (seleno)protein [Marinobacter sp. M216]|uniref:YHS domain-containing (Seleno)protein n=1 Tax=Marinobacter albus TaxID=3030833 RepID=A0ABT7HBR8_9GAMM|nr:MULTISPECIES: YHS domain-containing (seleno)protein [unclassified Marinobacter]MBW7470729.1 YHS domain-containing protein [Marinobacter sp. F4218]MDK9557001.1 YHS domain-containing (seleno)protein [Marinobacter sp. M216]